MGHHEDNVDEMTRGVLWLTSFENPVRVRTSNGPAWDTMERPPVEQVSLGEWRTSE